MLASNQNLKVRTVDGKVYLHCGWMEPIKYECTWCCADTKQVLCHWYIWMLAVSQNMERSMNSVLQNIHCQVYQGERGDNGTRKHTQWLNMWHSLLWVNLRGRIKAYQILCWHQEASSSRIASRTRNMWEGRKHGACGLQHHSAERRDYQLLQEMNSLASSSCACLHECSRAC